MRVVAAITAVAAMSVSAPVVRAQTSSIRTAPGLDVWTESSRSPYGVAFAWDVASFQVDRPTHVALFEAGRDGRLRVLFPRSPRDTGLVKPNKEYTARPLSSDVEFGGPFSLRVPVTFAIASDDPIDLSRFGGGKQWERQVNLNNDPDPNTLIEQVANLIVTRDSARVAAEYAYVAPQMSTGTFFAITRCVGLARLATTSHDYWFYRDLWGVGGAPNVGWYFGVGPAPTFWSAFGPMLTYMGGVNGLRLAGSRCDGGTGVLPTEQLAFGQLTPPFRRPQMPVDSVRRDSTPQPTTPGLRAPRLPVVATTVEQQTTAGSDSQSVSVRHLRPRGFATSPDRPTPGRGEPVALGDARGDALGGVEPLGNPRHMQPRSVDVGATWTARRDGGDRLAWRPTSEAPGRTTSGTTGGSSTTSGTSTARESLPRNKDFERHDRPAGEQRPRQPRVATPRETPVTAAPAATPTPAPVTPKPVMPEPTKPND